jgi:hypothetical protein
VFIFMRLNFLNIRVKSADLISTDVKFFYIGTATGTVQVTFFCIFFAGYSVSATPSLMSPFMIFEGCLDSNPECCRSTLAR